MALSLKIVGGDGPPGVLAGDAVLAGVAALLQPQSG